MKNNTSQRHGDTVDGCAHEHGLDQTAHHRPRRRGVGAAGFWLFWGAFFPLRPGSRQAPWHLAGAVLVCPGRPGGGLVDPTALVTQLGGSRGARGGPWGSSQAASGLAHGLCLWLAALGSLHACNRCNRCRRCRHVHLCSARQWGPGAPSDAADTPGLQALPDRTRRAGGEENQTKLGSTVGDKRNSSSRRCSDECSLCLSISPCFSVP